MTKVKAFGLHLQRKEKPLTLGIMNPMKPLVFILLFCLPLFGHAALGVEVTQTPEKKIPYSSLTPAEVQILKDGEISHGAQVAGGIIGTVFGLGIGQAIQGRYWPSGFVITAGEIGSFALMIAGANDCLPSRIGDPAPDHCHGDYIAAGLLAFIGFRIFELVDVWTGPDRINRQYWNLKDQVDPAAHLTFLPVTKIASSAIDGGVFQLRFQF